VSVEKSISDMSLRELYPDAADEVIAVVKELRALVRAQLPDAHEVFYHHILGYGSNESYFDRILYIAPQNGYANVGFFYGTHLADPSHLLEGSGKRMRHVKIRTTPLAASTRSDLSQLVREAWLDGVESVAQLHRSRSAR
jgi:Domain of unknown function (DU1801)